MPSGSRGHATRLDTNSSLFTLKLVAKSLEHFFPSDLAPTTGRIDQREPRGYRCASDSGARRAIEAPKVNLEIKWQRSYSMIVLKKRMIEKSKGMSD